MRDPGAGQRGQRMFAIRPRVVEPCIEAPHLIRHALRGRCFEVNRALIVRAGDDLHRIFMGPIAANHLDCLVRAQQHLVPCEQRRVVEGLCEVAVKVRHHLRDAALCRWDAGLSAAEPQLVAQGGLHAVTVEQFALDLGGLDRFLANQFDLEGLLIVGADMLAGTHELAGLEQELLFQLGQSFCFV